MKAPRRNPQPPEGINGPETSGFGEFLTLAAGLAVAAVVATAVLVVAAQRLAPLVPFQWERAVARGVEPGPASQYPQAREALQGLADELAGAADLPDGMSIRVHLTDQAMPNAFATLGGNVIVTRGLVTALSSENALAMVLAHEIAHVKHRDPVRALGRSAVVSLVWAALSGATGQSGVQDVLGSAGLMTALSFNRDMERDADRAALDTMRAHYGHIAGAGEFFRHMQERHGDAGPAYLLRTHPRSAERLAAITRRTRATEASLDPLPPALEALGSSGSGRSRATAE